MTHETTPNQTIDRNVEAIHRLRIESDQNRTLVQRLVDTVATFMGSTRSLLFHLALYGVLIFCNVVPIPFFQNSGMTLSTVGFIATIEAIFLAVFVLINQRRMNSIGRRHSDLDLQISLLTENELSEIAKALFMIGRKVGVDPAKMNSLRRIKRDTHPDEIVESLSHQESEEPTDLTSDPNLKHDRGPTV